MPRPSRPIPPAIDDQGRDSYPFVLIEGPARTPYSHWFDVVIALEASYAIGRTGSLRIEGFNPSHSMNEHVGILHACSVCDVVEETLGAVMPCGMDLAGRTPFEAAKEARKQAEESLG